MYVDIFNFIEWICHIRLKDVDDVCEQIHIYRLKTIYVINIR